MTATTSTPRQHWGEIRGGLTSYLLVACVSSAVLLGLFVRTRNLEAEKRMMQTAKDRAAALAHDVEQRGGNNALADAKKIPGFREAFLVSQSVVQSARYPFLRNLRIAVHTEPTRASKPLHDKKIFDLVVNYCRHEGPHVATAHLFPGPDARLVAAAPARGAGGVCAAVLVTRPDPKPLPLPTTFGVMLVLGAALTLVASRFAPRFRHGVVGVWGLAFLGYGLIMVTRPFGLPPTSALGWVGGAGVIVVALTIAGMRGAGTRLAQALAEHSYAFAYVSPALLGMSVLVLVPFVVGVGLSFFDHRHGTYTFVGLKNFFEILSGGGHAITDPLNFYFTLGATLLWTFVNVFLHTAIGLGLALMLRQPWLRLKGAYRVLLIIPWAVPNYITALIWKGMFHQQYGAVNHVLGLFGIAPISWFSSFFTAFSANVITNTWLGFPFMMVISLGALQSIPADIYEAAEVDGASRWQQFTRITLPLLRPALFPAITLGCIWTFNQFNIIYLVSRGEPGGATNILVTEAYRWAFERGERYGLAAAYAVLIFIVLLGWSWLNSRVSRATEDLY